MREEGLSIKALAVFEGVNDRYLFRILRLAMLAPAVVEAIARGQQPALLSAQTLSLGEVPACWRRQRAALGFS